MKGLIKLFSAAAFVGALASCSDDLSVNRAVNLDPDADFYAFFDEGETTRMGALNDAGMSIVWNQGDQIKLYSPDALAPNVYEIISGWGSANGSFKVIEGKDNGVASKPNLVAITSGNEEADNRVKVYATDEGQMGLIAKIPASFTQSEKTGDIDPSIVYWPLAVPYWANSADADGTKPISMNSEGRLSAYMKGLVGILKIDVKDLPEGTTAIVLNTHNFAYTSEADYKEHVNNPTYEKYNINGKTTGKELGGMDETLSGTLSTILEDGCKLTVDEDFKHADTLRVDFDMLQNVEDKIIYVPVVAQHYEKLTVLALTGRGDSEYPYVWPDAEVIEVFTDIDVKPGDKIKFATTAPIETHFDNTEDLSNFIANRILSDRKHKIKVINMEPITSAPTPLYIGNFPAGINSNVDIEFAKPNTADFDIVEATPNYNINTVKWTLDTEEPWLDYEYESPEYFYGYKTENHARFDVKSQDQKRKVTITFADLDDRNYNIILPTSKVILKVGAEGGVKFQGGISLDNHTSGEQLGDIYVLSANTRQVSGYTDLPTVDTDGNVISYDNPRNYTNAGIEISGSWNNITIHKNQFGDVYAKGDNINDEIQELEFDGSFVRASVSSIPEPRVEGMSYGQDTQIALRLSDMLIKWIGYNNIGTNGEGNIFTTGSSAIQDITEYTLHQDNHINLNASWTSKQLNDYALGADYDQGTIYTAAQLSSMGLASKKGLGTSPYDYEMADCVRSVWLGATLFPWLGADVTAADDGAISEPFSFDGKKCNFRNMYNDLYLGWIPYDCCCDDNNNKVKIREGLGLIRRIETTATIDIKNVNLKDALIKADKFYIENIGSVCGRATADGAITIENISADAIRVDAIGRNIGGAFGWLNSDTKVEIKKKLHVGESSSIFSKSWVTSKDKNVGGAIGLISGDAMTLQTYVEKYGDAYDFTWYNNPNKALYIAWDYVPEVIATAVDVYEEYVLSEDNNVGGQVGGVFAEKLEYGKDGMTTMKTHMNDRIRTIGSNVGGLIGGAFIDQNLNYIQGTVEVNNEIYGEFAANRINQDNSNLSGSNVGGLAGAIVVPKAWLAQTVTKYTTVEGNVRVDGYVTAENRNAGGFVGLYQANSLKTGASDKANKVKIGKTLQAIEGYVGGLYGNLNTAWQAQIGNSGTGSITIESAEIAGAMAVGGLIGASANGSAAAASSEDDKQLQIVTVKNKYSIAVKIKAWNNTKNADVVTTSFTRKPAPTYQLVGAQSKESVFYPLWYSTTNQQKFAGSFGTVIGWLNNVIYIADYNLSVDASNNVLAKFSRTGTNYWGAPEFTSTNPIFINSKKLNLLFFMQNISEATQIEQAITGQGEFYWGDENGYVGVAGNSAAGSGSYWLNSKDLDAGTNYNLEYDYRTDLTSNNDLWP